MRSNLNFGPGKYGKRLINESNRVHWTYNTLFVDWPLVSTIRFISDKLVLLIANRVLKAKETNIRILKNVGTRRANST